MQPCFIVMLIDRRPSGDVVKDNGEADTAHAITAEGLAVQNVSIFLTCFSRATLSSQNIKMLVLM